MNEFIEAFDLYVNDALMWLNDNATLVFELVRTSLDGAFKALDWLFAWPPYWVVITFVFALGWFSVSRLFAVGAAFGLWLCHAMGLWPETMTTLTLVVSSTVIALVVAIPAGVFIGLTAGMTKASEVTLDFIQTMPAYLYLLPGIALLGYGPTTAMWATALVAIPPAMRLTAHGIRMTPLHLRELGVAVGMTRMQTILKILVPCAFPSMMAGINQSLMMAFGMVVIAGIVGSGGLGQAVYDAVRMLHIDQSVNAGIAIVVLSIVLDRLSQRLGNFRSERDHG